MQQYIAEEIARLSANDDDARQQLQRPLAELDHHIARLRDHLKALDVNSAAALRFYDEPKTAAADRQKVEEQLTKITRKLPDLPDMAEIAARANAGLENLETIFASGTVDEQKELAALYVKTIKADPNACGFSALTIQPAFLPGWTTATAAIPLGAVNCLQDRSATRPSHLWCLPDKLGKPRPTRNGVWRSSEYLLRKSLKLTTQIKLLSRIPIDRSPYLGQNYGCVPATPFGSATGGGSDSTSAISGRLPRKNLFQELCKFPITKSKMGQNVLSHVASPCFAD